MSRGVWCRTYKSRGLYNFKSLYRPPLLVAIKGKRKKTAVFILKGC